MEFRKNLFGMLAYCTHSHGYFVFLYALCKIKLAKDLSSVLDYQKELAVCRSYFSSSNLEILRSAIINKKQTILIGQGFVG